MFSFSSLAACEHLYKAGYRNLSWLDGGFDAADDEVRVVCLPVLNLLQLGINVFNASLDHANSPCHSEQDFPSEGSVPLEQGGIGGVSEFVG